MAAANNVAIGSTTVGIWQSTKTFVCVSCEKTAQLAKAFFAQLWHILKVAYSQYLSPFVKTTAQHTWHWIKLIGNKAVSIGKIAFKELIKVASFALTFMSSHPALMIGIGAGIMFAAFTIYFIKTRNKQPAQPSHQ